MFWLKFFKDPIADTDTGWQVNRILLKPWLMRVDEAGWVLADSRVVESSWGGRQRGVVTGKRHW